jgi:hypothetical protein
MDFRNTINNWGKGAGVSVVKVRAHPERYLHHSQWSWDDKGIWTADRVAGKSMQSECSVSASRWLKRIGARSNAVIEELDGTPFIGSIRERASKWNIDRYWIERDGLRAKASLNPKWEGTNMALVYPLLMRNGGFEDYATMARLAGSLEDPSTIYAQIANRARELVDDIRSVRVDRDEHRRLLTLFATNSCGIELPASSLSDGTLRFLALVVLDDVAPLEDDVGLQGPRLCKSQTRCAPGRKIP